MRRSTILMAFCLLLSAGAAVWAEVVDNLYSALVPVADYSDGERDRALRQGLVDVLVKITGDRNIESRQGVRSMLANASQYVVAFGYKNLPESDGGQGLNIRFADAELDRVIRQNQLPVWPARRPNLLVWLIKENAGESPAISGADDAPEAFQALDRVFADRGLPVRHPLLDLQDQLALPLEDAWSMSADIISEASARYQTEGWLVIRAYQTSNLNWKCAWLSRVAEETHYDEIDAETLEDAVAQIGHSAVDRLVPNYTYIPSNVAGKLAVTVTDVADLDAYTAMMALLKGLSMVSHVSIRQVQGATVELLLDIEGDIAPFIETLSLSNQVVVPDIPLTEPGHLSLGWKNR